MTVIEPPEKFSTYKYRGAETTQTLAVDRSGPQPVAIIANSITAIAEDPSRGPGERTLELAPIGD